jgi:hypothetical protein
MTADDTPIPEANANAAQEASSDPSIQSNDDDGDGDGDVEMEAIKAQEDDCDSPARTPPPDISNSNKRRKSDNDNDDDDGGENSDSDSDSDNHNSAKDPKTAAMEQALHVQEVVDPLKEIPVVLKSVDTLRTVSEAWCSYNNNEWWIHSAFIQFNFHSSPRGVADFNIIMADNIIFTQSYSILINTGNIGSNCISYSIELLKIVNSRKDRS